MHTERRKSTRAPVAFNVVVAVRGQSIPVTTSNVSLRGMRCAHDSRFHEGETCRVTITLDREHVITIEATVVRASEAETGFFFASMDEDSFFHLKRLVQYNVDDADVIDDELAAPRQ